MRKIERATVAQSSSANPDSIAATEGSKLATRRERVAVDRSRALGIDPVLSIEEVSAVVIYSRATIYRMVAAGTFPRPIKLGPNRVGWRQSAVEAWLASRESGAA